MREAATGPDFGWIKRLPCHAENGIDTCPKREYPTAEEVERNDTEINKIITASMKARKAIKAIDHPKGANAAGSVECPMCGGVLRYTIAGCNGHVWAACETADCIRWME